MELKRVVDSYTLSPMQQGMLFNHLAFPGLGIYIQQRICSMAEQLDVAKFQQAWQRVADRHTILRTSFRWEGLNQPMQDVWQEARLPWLQLDWRDLSSAEQQEHLAAFLTADRRRGFVLTEAPLMRMALFRLDQASYRWVWTYDHALLDGRSIPLVLTEVFAFYEALLRGEDLQLDAPHPYREYIDWLKNLEWSKAELFWREDLTGFGAPTPVTMVRRSGSLPGAGDSSEVQEMRLSKTLTASLASFAQTCEVTLNTVLQGAWALLLMRYSGEEDVVFGATRACRRSTIPGADSMVGLFVNTVPMRARVTPDSKLVPWLKELRSQWIAMRPYEHTPLVKIRSWSNLPAGQPLFESLLVFENSELNSFMRTLSGNWERRKFQLLQQTSYPLTIMVYVEDELLVRIQYSRSSFDGASIKRMLGHLRTVLEEFINNPSMRLVDVPILTPEERHQLLVEWNQTASEYPREKSIHQLFEAQVEQTPEAVAVVFEKDQLTYRELNQRSNQLAHYLRARGVRSGTMVGICVERSLEMVIGLLGILKSGGVYVPLDPAHPKLRLEFMLEDTQAPILLTQEYLKTILPHNQIDVVCLDSEWDSIAKESVENVEAGVAPESLAYVIYTSGSTGRPKGTCIPHRAVVRLVQNTNYVSLTAEDVFLQFAPISFDASTFEIWGCLLNGGRLVVAPPYTPSLEELGQWIERYQVTTLWLTAALFQRMVEDNLQSLRQVRQLLAGGEVLPVGPARKVLEKLKGCQLINGYGPTENTTFTCCYAVTDSSRLERSVPIGRPIANTQVYVLDRHMQPVPVGVPGELYVGGDGLAQGYLNQPELTAEKFVSNPFNAEPGARLYRTGDLVRWLPDGTIEFLGRLDYQVKIRGFRVELGGIEAILMQHPAVHEVVVVAREDVPGNKRLSAYFVSNHSAPSTSELRDFLKARLPDYMVPAQFIELEAIPLNPNGKVDRRALPDPGPLWPDLEETYVAPRNPVEEALAQIWAEVLGQERVGIHDHFFELGGHSLVGTQLISRVRDTLRVALPLRALFEAPTVAEFASQVEKARDLGPALEEPPIVPVARDAVRRKRSSSLEMTEESERGVEILK